jgi:hypothetical protein
MHKRFLVVKRQRKGLLWGTIHRWEDNNKIDLRRWAVNGAEYGPMTAVREHDYKSSVSLKAEYFMSTKVTMKF